MILPVAALVAAAIALLGIVYALVAAYAVRRFVRRVRPAAPDAAAPLVTLLKPLHGLVPGLKRNLASFVRQDHPAPVQLLLGFQDPADPALAVARRLQEEAGAVAVEIVVDQHLHGPNRKVGNLANMAARARHPIIVLADSDMRVPLDYLRRVTGPLADPGVGLVTCLYRGVPADEGPWSVLAAMGLSYGFLPSVLIGRLVGADQGCFGSTMALRRETLERLGGFEAFAHHLADDYAIGAAVRSLGLEVRLADLVIDHVSHEPTFRSLWSHELRWARTVRLLSPWGHAGTLVTHALPAALLCATLWPSMMTALLLLAATAARLFLARTVDAELGNRPRRWPLVPLRDLLSFAIFVASFGGRGVVWRGRRFDVDRAGLMTERGRVSSG